VQLRREVNNQLFTIIVKCQHLESLGPNPDVLDVTTKIKEIAFRVSEMLDSPECCAERIAAAAITAR